MKTELKKKKKRKKRELHYSTVKLHNKSQIFYYKSNYHKLLLLSEPNCYPKLINQSIFNVLA